MRTVVGGNFTALPLRPEGPGLGNFSNVLTQPLRCWPNAPLQFHKLKARLHALIKACHVSQTSVASEAAMMLTPRSMPTKKFWANTRVLSCQ
jgi:hypothetical protein